MPQVVEDVMMKREALQKIEEQDKQAGQVACYLVSSSAASTSSSSCHCLPHFTTAPFAILQQFHLLRQELRMEVVKIGERINNIEGLHASCQSASSHQLRSSSTRRCGKRGAETQSQ
eukprot:748054-Hanusia_phi.AAC.2